MRRVILVLIVCLTLCIPCLAQVKVEVYAPARLGVVVAEDKAESRIVKYNITRRQSRYLVTLTAIEFDVNGHILNKRTDRMGRHAEVAWAKEAKVRRLVLIAKVGG